MKTILILPLILFSTIAFADVFSYEFAQKEIVIIDESTEEAAIVNEFVVYHDYEFPCILDGSRPSKCVEGKTEIFPVQNGRVTIPSFKLNKKHLFAKKPRIGLQVTGAGLWWYSLEDFNKLPNNFTLRIKFHN